MRFEKIRSVLFFFYMDSEEQIDVESLTHAICFMPFKGKIARILFNRLIWEKVVFTKIRVI